MKGQPTTAPIALEKNVDDVNVSGPTVFSQGVSGVCVVNSVAQGVVTENLNMHLYGISPWDNSAICGIISFLKKKYSYLVIFANCPVVYEVFLLGSNSTQRLVTTLFPSMSSKDVAT